MQSVKAAAPMTKSAQATARAWLEASLERAERFTRTVSGEGEHAEILATILALLDDRKQLLAALQDLLECAEGECVCGSAYEPIENAKAAIAKAEGAPAARETSQG